MSESAVVKVAQVSQMSEKNKKDQVEPGQTLIRGKVSSRTRVGKLYIQIISSPAPDEYSYPKAYEVSSREPLGEVDDRIVVVCEITGRRVQKSWTNPETGEVKKFPGAYVGLRAVEDDKS